jgi:hypothetical protein
LVSIIAQPKLSFRDYHNQNGKFITMAAKNPIMTSAYRTSRVKNNLAKTGLAISLAIGLGLALPTMAQAKNISPPSLRSDAPNVYVVKKGDTLWDISGRFLKTPWRWPEIWASNKHVKNPHWIYPGDRLLLCLINGKSVIGRDEGDGCDGIAKRMIGDAGLPVVHLQPQVRVEALNVAIPAIPLANIKHWLEHSQVLPVEQVIAAPYVVGTKDKRVISAAGQSIYARGKGLEVGQTYGVYRENISYLTEKSKENLGREVTQVATGVVTAVNDDIATIELTKSFDGEVRNQDRVLPINDAPLPNIFYPIQPDQVKEGGRVLRILDSISAAAKGSVIVLDRGTTDGTAVGQVFAVYQKGSQIKDPKTGDKLNLPSERTGMAMIFRSFERVSYAYVLESELPIKVDDEIRSPLGDLEDKF